MIESPSSGSQDEMYNALLQKLEMIVDKKVDKKNKETIEEIKKVQDKQIEDFKKEIHLQVARIQYDLNQKV